MNGEEAIIFVLLMRKAQVIANFVLRYRLLHILFWVWATVSMAHVLENRRGGGMPLNLISSASLTVCQMIAVYLTIYWLLPKLFNGGKYLKFGIAALGVIMGTAVLSTIADEAFVYIVYHKHLRFYLIKFISESFDTIVVTGIFIAIVVIQGKLQSEIRARKQAGEQLRAELDFLKAQINPHFLFNTINNIYVLIEEDKKKGSQMLLRFSELLRYQLYECNEGKIPIFKELQFIRNFIEMEQLRLGDAVSVEIKIPEEQDYFEIAPFILLPFVENAFKHVSHHDHKRNFISIRAVSAQGEFRLIIWNSSNPIKQERPGGIGLANVRRRLELLYPGRYDLDIHEEDEIHYVELKLYVR